MVSGADSGGGRMELAAEADSGACVGLGVVAPPVARIVRRRNSAVDTMHWGLAPDPIRMRFIQTEIRL